MNARSASRILLTGFEPFDGETLNPSLAVVHELKGERIGAARVEPLILPVEFAGAIAQLEHAVERIQPALILCLGQAGGRARLGLERVALNLIDARIPDAAGAQPVDVPVFEGSPDARFCRLPLKAMLAAMIEAGVPAELSLSAGTYVCNALFFALLDRICTRDSAPRGGFIHLPFLPRQAARHPGAPALDIETQCRGVAIALDLALADVQELHPAGGAIC